MTIPVVIETNRLRLRPWALSDAAEVFRYARDPEWARYLPVPQPYLRTDADGFVSSQILLDRAREPAWAITLDDGVIGGVNLRLESRGRTGEIGYAVSRSHWRWGIATEAAQAVVDEAFSRLAELDQLRAVADARNVASTRVMEHVGMTRECLHRQTRLLRGMLIDEVRYGISRRVWQEVRPVRGRGSGGEDSVNGHRRITVPE